MHLTFNQSPSDLTDLTLHSFRQNPWIKVFGLVFLGGILFNLYQVSQKEDFQMEELLSWIIPIVIIIIMWVVIMRIINKRRFQNPANKNVLIGRREVELLDDHIRVITPVADTQYQWSAITKLGQSKKNYFLYLGSARAIIVSKTAFNSPSEEQEFEQLIFSKIK